MAVDGSLNFDTKIDEGGFNKGVSQISGGLSSLKGAFVKLGAVAAAAFSFSKIIEFGKESISLASDIQEVQNVVDVSFGSMSDKMEDFADTAIEKFGMSKLAAKQTGSTFMAMSVGMGIAQDSASDMALSLTGLSADMASFYNVEQDVTATALKSVFTGETETLKQFGIVMTEANLEAYALSQGITTSYQSMSQAEKVQLRYGYVMQQTALAQGDFARTSDSWANQTRILSEKWKEFSATVGQALMNVVLPVVQTLNSVLQTLIEYANKAYSALAELFGWETKSEDSENKIASSTKTAADNYKKMSTNAKKAQKSNEKSLASFDSLNKLSAPDKGSDSSSSDSASASVASTPVVQPKLDTSKADKNVSAWIGKLKEMLKGFQEYAKKYSPSFTAWAKAFDKMKQPAVTAFEKVKSSSADLWNNGIKPLGGYLINEFAPNCSNAFSEAFAPIAGDIGALGIQEFGNNFEWSCNMIVDEIIPRLTAAIGLVEQIWCDMMGGIKSAWDTYGSGIVNGISGFCASIRELISNLWDNFLGPLIDGIGATIDWLWNEHLKYLWDNIVSFFASLTEAVLTVWNNFLSPIVNFVVTVVGPVIASVVNSIVSVIGTIIAVVSDVCSGIFKALEGLMNFITGVFSGDWEKAWGGIKTFFKGIWDAIWGIVKGVINLIIDALNLIWGAVYSVVAGIVNGIGGIAGALGSLFGQDWHFSMPTEPPLIPKLATGTVVPANYGEFLAVLGDNKSETEVVSPLSTMKQAFLEALAESGSTGGTRTINLNVMLDGSKIYSTIVKYNNANKRRTGKNALA